MSFQLLLTISNITGDGYEIKADTNLPDDETVKKVLRDALSLMENEDADTDEAEVSTYRAASDTDKDAGLYWPEHDEKLTY